MQEPPRGNAVQHERGVPFAPEAGCYADAAVSRVRILVLSEVRFVRDALAGCLAQCDGVELVGGVASAREALDRVRSGCATMVLVDLSRPESLTAVRALAGASPGASIVAFAVCGEHDMLACAEAGASGYVPHDASMDDLLGVVHAVSRGELPCSPREAASLFRRLATLAAHGTGEAYAALTARERQIGLLIERGLSNKEIARSLHIELTTVKNHVHNILEKFGVGTRGAAAARVRASATLLRD